jgi:hypothetical protein
MEIAAEGWMGLRHRDRSAHFWETLVMGSWTRVGEGLQCRLLGPDLVRVDDTYLAFEDWSFFGFFLHTKSRPSGYVRVFLVGSLKKILRDSPAWKWVL